MKPINFREKQIEKVGQELGDAYIIAAKSYLLCSDTIKEIVELVGSDEVNRLVLRLTKDLENVQLMYSTEGEDTNV